MADKQHLPLVAILRDTLHQIEQSHDPRKNELVVVSLKHHLNQVIADCENSGAPQREEGSKPISRLGI